MYIYICEHFVDIVFFQQKAREEREAKRSMLDQRHEFLLQTIADCLDLSVEEATDALLEGTQVITKLTILKNNFNLHVHVHVHVCICK